MKKYLFNFENNIEELCILCGFTILNNTDELLRQNLYVKEVFLGEYIRQNLEDLIKLVLKSHENIENGIKDLVKSIDVESMDGELGDNVPAIDKNQFEKLVVEAINYIDPTNKLLEYYLKLKQEDKLKIEPLEKDQPDNSCFAYDPETGKYGIYLNTTGTILDVVGLMHELGHLYYTFLSEGEKSPNEAFDEFPSIYFELKTLEFLKTKGYSEEELILANRSRTYSNIDYLLSVAPMLKALYRNKDRNVEDYDISDLKVLIDKVLEMDPASLQKFGFTEEQARQMINDSILQQCNRFLNPTTDVLKTSMYLIGTNLAEHSIKNLKHEDVLEILNKIRTNPYSVYDVVKMFDIDPNTLDLNNTNDKPKEKKIGTKKEDK